MATLPTAMSACSFGTSTIADLRRPTTPTAPLPSRTSDTPSSAACATETDVVVIGAGISGLACASRLRSAGLRVTLLEARHRLGGRLHTVPLSAGPGRPTYPVDLGAAWVHGIGSAAAPNQLYRLANDMGLGPRPTDYADAAVYGADGSRLSDSAVADIERIYQLFERHLHSELLHSTDPRVAVMPIQTALDAFAVSRRLSRSESAALSFAVSNHMEHYWAGEAAVMAVAALDEVVLPGGDVVLSEGYGGMVAGLAAGLEDVRLGNEVLAVQYGGGAAGTAGVVVTARVLEPPSAAGGSGAVRLSARAAVVTLPVGVLKSGAVEFEPPLAVTDPAKAAAIARLGVAVYNKVVMLYDPTDVFWDDTAFIYRIPAPWEAGRWSYFLNLQKVCGAPILVAFNLGASAVQLEAANDEQVVAGALQALAGMYGTARVRLPRRAVVTRWGSDPYSRMSYTYVPAGLTGAAFDDLARPVLDRLFFAGEATHRRHYGTALGAYDSGRLAAAAILRQFTAAAAAAAGGSPLPPRRLWSLGHIDASSLPPSAPLRATRANRRPSGGSWNRSGGSGAGATAAAAICLAPAGGEMRTTTAAVVDLGPSPPSGAAAMEGEGWGAGAGVPATDGVIANGGTAQNAGGGGDVKAVAVAALAGCSKL